MVSKSNKIGNWVSYYPLSSTEGYYEIEGIAGVRFLGTGPLGKQTFDVLIDGKELTQCEIPRLRSILDSLSELIITAQNRELVLLQKWEIGLDKYLNTVESQAVSQINKLREDVGDLVTQLSTQQAEVARARQTTNAIKLIVLISLFVNLMLAALNQLAIVGWAALTSLIVIGLISAHYAQNRKHTIESDTDSRIDLDDSDGI